jgi:hypothetical protein
MLWGRGALMWTFTDALWSGGYFTSVTAWPLSHKRLGTPAPSPLPFVQKGFWVANSYAAAFGEARRAVHY